MKFYTEITDCKIKETEKTKYFILSQKDDKSGILCFLPRRDAKELETALKNEEWKNGVVEIEYYSYKSKSGDYKTCFRIVDILPCYPLGE